MKFILEIFWAVVSASTGFLRNAPDYESPLETQLMMGSVVQVEETRGYWCRVTAMEPSYQGWINDLQISLKSEAELDAYLAAEKYVCIADRAYVYDSALSDGARICDIVMGEFVRNAYERQGARVKVLLPDEREGWMDACDVEDFRQWALGLKADAAKLERQARSFLGTTYMWGGVSPKYFDCSGLVRLTYYMNGILLPRNASQMVRLGEVIPEKDMARWCKGDLVFFGTPANGGKPARVSHVAMYLGDGYIIHSSKVVRVSSLLPSGADYYEREAVAVRRMLGHVGEKDGPQALKDCPWYFVQ